MWRVIVYCREEVGPPRVILEVPVGKEQEAVEAILRIKDKEDVEKLIWRKLP